MSDSLWGGKVMRQGNIITLITEEPYDRIGHVRICGGGWPVMSVSTRTLGRLKAVRLPLRYSHSTFNRR